MYHLFASQGFGADHDGATLFDASTFVGHLYRGSLMFSGYARSLKCIIYILEILHNIRVPEAKAWAASPKFLGIRWRMDLALFAPMMVIHADAMEKILSWELNTSNLGEAKVEKRNETSSCATHIFFPQIAGSYRGSYFSKIGLLIPKIPAAAT